MVDRTAQAWVLTEDQLGNFTREYLSTIAGSCDMPFQSNSCKFVCLSVSWKWAKEVGQGV